MFDRFTENAREVMNRAKESALRRNHDYIGPEHILLGLIEVKDSSGVHVLTELGIDPTTVRAEVERIIGHSKTMLTGSTIIPFTPRGKKVLELCLQEAMRLGHGHIGTEHLLLGLIKDPESVAARVLVGFGLSVETVRERLLDGDESRRGAETEAASPRTDARGMFERFTDRARQVLNIAKQEAQRLHHEYIGTEHILLGLTQEGSGVAASVLESLGIDPEKIRSELEKIIKATPTSVHTETLPFTPRAKRVLERSLEASVRLGHDHIGTGHLLFGLVRDSEGIASKVLTRLGVKLDVVRKMARDVLDGDTPPEGD